jgi:hypothetical protein
MTIIRCLLTTDGKRINFDSPLTLADIERLIGADTLDTVNLADRVHVMVVDDIGHQKGLPLNKPATLLYWDRCGGPNDWAIVGDVVIVPDSDFIKKETYP